MPLRQVAHGSRQQRKALRESLRDSTGREHADLRRSELDRQRQALEGAADHREVRGVLRGHVEAGLDGLRPVDEQRDRGGAGRWIETRGSAVRWSRQRRHLVHALTADAQHDPARDQERRGRGDRVQPHEHRSGFDDLLEVVEHDEHLAVGQRARDALLELRFAVVADAEVIRDRRQQQTGFEHALQQHEVRAVREEILGGPRRLDRQSALADAARTDEADHPVRPTREHLPHRCDVGVPADGGGVRRRDACDEGCRHPVVLGVGDHPGLVEALGEQHREVAGHLFLELVRGVEVEVGGGVVGLDALDQLGEALVPRRRLLDVDELRHSDRGEVVLVLESRDVLVGSHPAVALAVDADEHVALREVRAIELAGRMGPRAELEHDGREPHPLDGATHRPTLVREFAQRRTHEHPDPLVRRTDHGVCDPSHVAVIPQHPKVVKDPAGHGASSHV